MIEPSDTSFRLDPGATDALTAKARTMGAILEILLDVAVQQMEARGGPVEADYAYSRQIGEQLAGSGDALMFGGATGGTRAGTGQIARALAPVAWHPGGLALGGRVWRMEK